VTAYYSKYCKILSRGIKELKGSITVGFIAKSNNQIKTAWNIIKYETGKLYVTGQT
jgi:hypothetical protein